MSISEPSGIVHNGVRDLNRVMEHYDTHIDKLIVGEKVLCDRGSNDRIIATCFAEFLAKHVKHIIERFKVHIHRERWGTVSHAILCFDGVKGVLRMYFSIEECLMEKFLLHF